MDAVWSELLILLGGVFHGMVHYVDLSHHFRKCLSKDVLYLTPLACFNLQFIAAVMDIPNFNLLCDAVPYVRDDARQNRVGDLII